MFFPGFLCMIQVNKLTEGKDCHMKKFLAAILVLALCLSCIMMGANAEPGITLENVRDYVVGLNEQMKADDGSLHTIINFDNAATTPALQPVMDEVNAKLATYGAIGRSTSLKSNVSTDIYEKTRKTIMKFVGADLKQHTLFYVNSTTDGLNKLASALITSEDDVVLCTRMEHHANDLSWRERCKVIYAEVDEQGRIIYEDLERLLKENQVKYVAVTAASNVTGYVTDVHRIAKMAHENGAQIIVDGAQIVAHRKFSMQGETPEEMIDYFVFSAHKMYSPYGGGAVIGLKSELDKHQPKFYGGGTVEIVADDWVSFKTAPELYEAGSPNYPGIVGMGKAAEILQEIGFEAIEEHEQKLIRRLIDGLKQFDSVIIYGDSENTSDRVGVVSFNFSDANSNTVAYSLSQLGAAVRRGAFCAHPYVWRLMDIPDKDLQSFIGCMDFKTPGMIRVSFGIYNTEEEVDEFLKMLAEVLPAAQAEAADPDSDVSGAY